MLTIATYDHGAIRAGAFEDLEHAACTWAHYTAPTADELAAAAGHLRIPVEELTALLSRTSRPTIREWHGHTLIVFRSPREGRALLTKPIVIAISSTKHDILSFVPHPSKSIERVLAMSDARKIESFAAGPTAVLFTLLDEIVNSYFHIFDTIDDELGRIEDAVRTGDVSRKVMDRIYDLKKTLIFFHKALVGNREVIAGIERDHAAALDRDLLAKFTVLHDQLVQLVELEATYRDILSSTLEVHLATVSNYLNVTVKQVTSWGAIILIPSLIAAIFGMNFDPMPWVRIPHGFYWSLGLMGISTVTLYAYFKKKDWIS